MQGFDVIATAYAFAVDEDIRYCVSSGHSLQHILKFLAHFMLVEFDDERVGYYKVLFEKDELRFFGVGAVGLGEDND